MAIVAVMTTDSPVPKWATAVAGSMEAWAAGLATTAASTRKTNWAGRAGRRDADVGLVRADDVGAGKVDGTTATLGSISCAVRSSSARPMLAIVAVMTTDSPVPKWATAVAGSMEAWAAGLATTAASTRKTNWAGRAGRRDADVGLVRADDVGAGKVDDKVDGHSRRFFS